MTLTQAVDQRSDSIAVGILRETAGNEQRVALVPEDVAKLTSDVRVIVQRAAGSASFYGDEAYEAAGAELADQAHDVAVSAAVVPVVRPPEPLPDLRPGTVVTGFLDPARNPTLLERLAGQKVTAFAVELIPRITRAQSMDALSSMSTIAGYRAVLLAAEASKRMFPMLITAAGTQPPCRLLVLGAGVAGLQALATGRRMGAMTFGFDTRPEVREQVQSVGATFVEMPQELQVEGTAGGYAREVGADFLAREQQAIRPHLHTSDAVITTALIPGKPAPVLITTAMLEEMKPGAVIVDLAAEQGGNCELTRAGESVTHEGVTVLGPINLPGDAATQASQMYSRNISNFLRLLVKGGSLSIDFDDEIVKAACVTHDGRVLI